MTSTNVLVLDPLMQFIHQAASSQLFKGNIRNNLGLPKWSK
jgi:hypothetical protein